MIMYNINTEVTREGPEGSQLSSALERTLNGDFTVIPVQLICLSSDPKNTFI